MGSNGKVEDIARSGIVVTWCERVEEERGWFPNGLRMMNG